MKLLPLVGGLFAQVDTHWFDYLMQWNWYAQKGRHTYYVMRIETIDKKSKKIYMHRIIMATPPDLLVDHQDGNGLNCLEENMRNCSKSQNGMNRITMRGASQFLGVWCRRGGFEAEIKVDGKKKRLGHFKIEEDAARAYDKAAKQFHKEFAHLNFPEK